MGELARFYNGVLGIGADLRVIPMDGWRRHLWLDQTGIPWVKPSPNMPSLTAALLYPSVVAFEATNVSVGRGTPEAFSHLGAPWLNAKAVIALLEEQDLSGVRFEAETFTPQRPGDGKFAGRKLPGIRIVVEDRDRVNSGRLGAALVWAIGKVHRDSLRIRLPDFDMLFGSAAARQALLRGEDPDAVIDATMGEVVAFQRQARPYLLYR